MENLSHADEDYNLWLLLLKVRRAIFKARERELSKYGITPEQVGVLYIVQSNGEKITPAEISRLTLREPHTVSGLIDRMTKAGLVRKVKDLSRKNLVKVSMTKKGRQAYIQSTKRESIQDILSCLSKKERQQMRVYLEKLQDKAIEVLEVTYKSPCSKSR